MGFHATNTYAEGSYNHPNDLFLYCGLGNISEEWYDIIFPVRAFIRPTVKSGRPTAYLLIFSAISCSNDKSQKQKHIW